MRNTYDTTTLGMRGTSDFPVGSLTQSVATTYYPDSTSATVTEQFQHDQRGRLTNQTMQLGLPVGWNVTTSLPISQLALSYNDANQVTTMSATAGPASYSFTSIYDGTTGSLQGLSSGSGGGSPNLSSLAYNEYAQISGVTTLNGSSTQIASVQYSYDANLRPTTLTANWLPGSGNSGEILGQTRGYDNASNVTGVSGFFASVPGQSNSGGTETQNFCYDEQNRLTWSGNGGTQPGAGNGTCGTGTLGNTLNGAGYTAPYQYTNLGQLWQGPLNGQGTNQQYLYCDSSHPHQLSGLYPLGTACANRSGAVYTAGYDAWGNQTSRSTGGVTATLSYDALNRLVGYNAGSNAQEWYLYNASSERVLKRSLSGSTTTLTVYAFGLQELSYSGAGALTSQIEYYALAGHLIGSTNGTTTTYYLADAQGSVLTSLSASAIVGQQVYGPYGNTRYQVGSLGTTKGYTGQFHDAVSGLDYYHARYYDPVIGQFLSVDSVQGNMLGYDPYAYVGGNPETMIDPTGNAGCGFWCVAGIVAVAVAVVATVVLAPVAVPALIGAAVGDAVLSGTAALVTGAFTVSASAAITGASAATAHLVSDAINGSTPTPDGIGQAAFWGTLGGAASPYTGGWSGFLAVTGGWFTGTGSAATSVSEPSTASLSTQINNTSPNVRTAIASNALATATTKATATASAVAMAQWDAQRQEEMGKENRELVQKLTNAQDTVRNNTIHKFHLSTRWTAPALSYYTYQNFLAEYSLMGNTSAPILLGRNRFL